MKKNTDAIKVDKEEVVQIFLLLEKLNAFFHQPLNYENDEDIKAFIQGDIYPMISEAYYEIVWNWLPPEIQQEMEER